MISSATTTIMSPLGRFMANLTRERGNELELLDDNARAVLLESAKPKSSSTGTCRWQSSCTDSSSSSSSSNGHVMGQQVQSRESSPPPPPPPPPLVVSMRESKKPLISPQIASSRKSIQHQEKPRKGSCSSKLPTIPQKPESPMSCRWEQLLEERRGDVKQGFPIVTRRSMSLPPSLPKKEVSPIPFADNQGVGSTNKNKTTMLRTGRLPESLRNPPYPVVFLSEEDNKNLISFCSSRRNDNDCNNDEED